ncbi:MAG TPA: divalent metal cation transporter [Candidatus Paceibacterota bacterium]|nr:divalent metal cation transporter [Candidatus Paceibacterota bacterium]
MASPQKENELLKSIGPGFVTGAADDDPSGIGTYSQTGALFGYTQLWLVPYALPFMIAIQEMCGRIGAVTGKGLSGVLREHYSRAILWGAVTLLLIANTINIGADLGAMASAIGLLAPIPLGVSLAVITLFSLALQISVPYPRYAKFLKYLTLSLLGYVIAAFVVRQDWSLVLSATLIPHLSLSKEYVINIAAMLGTTISPYLFFWQADEEVEEEIADHQLREIGVGVPKITGRIIRRLRLDTALGMLFSQVITFFIIATVAGTLHGMSINTAADAAQALRPLAGNFAFLLFALGIISTGLLAVPVLAGSAAFAVAEAAHWKVGLEKRFDKARMFYGVIVVCTLVGIFINFIGIGPIALLYYSAALNGVLAPPLMLIILFIGNNKKILGDRTNGALSNILGIAITLAMAAVALLLLWNFV